MPVKKTSKVEKASNKITRVGSLVSAVIVIIGAATGICTWVSNQFQSAVSGQISELRDEVQASDKKTETQITRLELMTLIDTQPDNIAEIEKVAKHYFKDLGADWYMTGIYSQWAKAHGGDIDLIIGVD